jgi:hypothetical protein
MYRSKIRLTLCSHSPYSITFPWLSSIDLVFIRFCVKTRMKTQGRSNREGGGGGGGLQPPNNLLIIILFSKFCRPLSILSFINFKRLHYPWQTARNEDITHSFLQLILVIQYIVNKIRLRLFLYYQIVNFDILKRCFLTIRILSKSSPKSRKWHFRDSRFKNFLGPSALAFAPPTKKSFLRPWNATETTPCGLIIVRMRGKKIFQ